MRRPPASWNGSPPSSPLRSAPRARSASTSCARFLFALTCAPELVLPSEWLPLVFGETEPEYRDTEEAEHVVGAVMALYNEIARQARVEHKPQLPVRPR